MSNDLPRRNVLRAAAAVGVGGVAAATLAARQRPQPGKRSRRGRAESSPSPRTRSAKPRPATAVDRYSFGQKGRLWVRMLTYGATIQSIEVPDRWGRVADVHLGFNTIEEYQALTRISAPRSAALPTGSPRVSSRWTVSNTRSRSQWRQRVARRADRL